MTEEASGNSTTGTKIGPDEVELLKRYREKFLPDSRITASDGFAKWLFGLTVTIAALGAGFSNSAFSKLSGLGTTAYGAAVLLTGLGLGAAAFALSVDLPYANWQSLESMFSQMKSSVSRKRIALRVAASSLALALIAAAAAPLLSLSGAKSAETAVEYAGLTYKIIDECDRGNGSLHEETPVKLDF